MLKVPARAAFWCVRVVVLTGENVESGLDRAVGIADTRGRDRDQS
jgi:hypothetical protein